MLKIGEEITLTTTDQTILGSALAKLDGLAVFVRGAVAGDVCVSRITEIKKNYAYAECERIITPSCERITPDCPAFSACGGCVHRNINYVFEGKVKENSVKSAFSKAGVKVGKFAPIVMPSEFAYRNKVTFHVDPVGKIGYYAAESKTLVDLSGVSCATIPQNFLRIARTVQTLTGKTGPDGLQEVMLRCSTDGDVCVALTGKLSEGTLSALIAALCSAHREVTGIVKRNGPKDKYRTVMGDRHLTSRLMGLDFRISPEAFFQVNYEGAQALLSAVYSAAKETGATRCADLYCGTGTFGLTLAAKLPGMHVVGVEINADAVADAKHNAKANGCTNIEFFCGDAARYAESDSPELVVVDPPRRGLSSEAIGLLEGIGAKDIIYVSCNPYTLARDCSRLGEYGYEVCEVTCVNMFPRSEHVECVVRICRE